MSGILLMLAAPHSLAATPITVERLDGTTLAGEFRGLSETGLRLEVAGNEATIDLGEVAAIDLNGERYAGPSAPRSDSAAPATTARPCRLFLRGGGRISAVLLEGRRDALVVGIAGADRAVIPFTVLQSVEFPDTAGAACADERSREAGNAAAPTQDVLIVTGEETRTLRGTLLELGPQDSEFVFNQRSRRLRTERICTVLFAPGGQEITSPPALAYRTDGDVWPVRLLPTPGPHFCLGTAFCGDLDVPLAALTRIELNSSRIVYLSELTPISSSCRGLIHRTWTVQQDRNVLGGPLMLGGRSHARGLGMHSECTVAFQLGGEYATFAATVGRDDAAAGPRGVIFVVLGDNRELWRSPLLSGRDDPLRIAIPVGGVGVLTLRAEYGPDADVGDWADWGSARLIKPREAVEP